MANQQQSAEEIFETALDLPAEQRPSYVVEACRGSVQLREQVERLLNDYKRMGSFLGDSPLAGKTEDVDQLSRPALATGQKLGRYTVIEAIGSTTAERR